MLDSSYIHIYWSVKAQIKSRHCFYFTENLSKKFGTQINELWDNFGSDFTYPGNLPAYVEEYFEDQEKQQNDLPPGRIQCLPAPGNAKQSRRLAFSLF